MEHQKLEPMLISLFMNAHLSMNFHEADSTESLIFIMYDTNARFYFYNNQLDIIEPSSSFHVFDSGDPISVNGKYVFTSNCISSTDENIITSSTESLLNIIFETDFRSSCPNIKPKELIEPTQEPIECHSKPSGPVDDLKNLPTKYTSKSVLYGCDLDIKTKIDSQEHCVHLYYCKFNNLRASEIDEGGAIYISTTRNGPNEKKNHI